MNKPARIMTLVGTILIALAIVVEFVLVILQTDPSATSSEVTSITMVLLFGGAFFFDGAYVEWKQEVNYIISIAFVVIGIVGFSVVRTFHNALVDVFLPKTYILAFLYLNFIALAIFGAFQPLIGRSLKTQSSTIKNSV